MKYLSEVTKQAYDSIEELEAAEEKALKAKDERKVEADKVSKAYEAMKKARLEYEKATQAYQDALGAFCEKYGSYKTTLKSGEIYCIDPFFRFFNF